MQVSYFRQNYGMPLLTFADFLATYSLDDDTFGELLWITDVPTSGNDPHHLGPSLDGKTLIGGGLLSLLKTQVSTLATSSLVFLHLHLVGHGLLLRH